MTTAASTPAVLLTVWRRPDETQRVLRVLQRRGPLRLFVAGDGPRSETDLQSVNEVRALVEEARQWCSGLHTSFSSKHLGCRGGMERAINWFFEHVDEGIILEDDCVPSSEFFDFAGEALQRFREDPRVLHVSGDCSMPLSIDQDWSYCFVRYPHSWGWATWRRAWALYDSDMASWKDTVAAGRVADVFPDEDERRVWAPIFTRLAHESVPDSWAWRWAASCIIRDGLSVQPLTNLVTNIGFGELATHTRRPGPRSAVESGKIFPLRHPPATYRHLTAERQILEMSQMQRSRRSKTFSVAMAFWAALARPRKLVRIYQFIRSHRHSSRQKHS